MKLDNFNWYFDEGQNRPPLHNQRDLIWMISSLVTDANRDAISVSRVAWR